MSPAGDDLGDGFDAEGMLPLDPSPDEDAWEAFLTLALERLEGTPDNGLTNAQLAELESLLGTQLPFELGLLLVMGVPDGERWWRWDDDPAGQLARWNDQLLSGVLFDVEHNSLWLSAWGDRPADPGESTAVVTEAFVAASPLLPIYGHRAMPIGLARGEQASEANPVLSIVQTDCIVYGTDLAAWLHREFEVPLPMWPETADRWFPFWSDFVELN